MPARFDETIAAQWREALIGAGQREGRHWRTKVSYYKAVSRLLLDSPDRRLRWQHVVAEVEPKGSRSTFYDVTGPNATHSLLARYRLARSLDCTQIAYWYRRSVAVHQLIDETKVWSYWPLREKWLAAWRGQVATARDGDGAGPDAAGLDEAKMAQSLQAAVRGWAHLNPTLAAAVDCSPPVCAVEDLTLLCRGRGQLAPRRALDLLTEIVAAAARAPAAHFTRMAVPAQLIPALS